jgi:hypothetical protein
MKKSKLLIFASILFMFSCEKTYNCHITTSDGTTTTEADYKFTGTSKEMKDFENSAVNSSLITQTIDCK